MILDQKRLGGGEDRRYGPLYKTGHLLHSKPSEIDPGEKMLEDFEACCKLQSCHIEM